MKLLQSWITCCCLLLFSAAYSQSGWVTGPNGRLIYVNKPVTEKPYVKPDRQTNYTPPVKKEKDKPIDKNYFHSTKGEYKTTGYSYNGEYRYNSYVKERHGFGKCVYKNGDVYEGKWSSDEMYWEGTYTTAAGKVYTGVWKAGKFVGVGTFNSDILGVKDDGPATLATTYAASYDFISDVENGFAVVKKGDKYGFIDVKGNVVAPLIYEASGFRFSDGLLNVMLNGKWGFINGKVETIIPFIYEYAASFSEGLVMVKSGGKYGHLDKTGKVVIPFKYQDAGSFFNGLAWVKLGTRYGAVNKKGVEIIPVKYDDIGYVDGKLKAVLDGVTSYFDKTGKKISQ